MINPQEFRSLCRALPYRAQFLGCAVGVHEHLLTRYSFAFFSISGQGGEASVMTWFALSRS